MKIWKCEELVKGSSLLQLATRTEKQLFYWFGHEEGMGEDILVKRTTESKANGVRMRGRSRMG